jgi:hypothetical protein
MSYQYPYPPPIQSNNKVLMFGGFIVALITITSILMYINSTSDTSNNLFSSFSPSSPSSSPSPSRSSSSSSSTSSIPSVNCKGAWETCSAPCGIGTKKYKITTPKEGEGRNCEEVDGASKSCKIKDCPVNCVGEWIEPCSAPCGDGSKIYKITTPKQGDGTNCPFGDGASQACKIKDCPPPAPPAPPAPPSSYYDKVMEKVVNFHMVLKDLVK